MTVVRDAQERLGATFLDAGDRAIPADYGRPESAHRAVRNGVGVTETAYDVLEVPVADARAVGDVVTASVPATERQGVYALVCDGQGAVRADCYVHHAGERFLLFCSPETGPVVAEAVGDAGGEVTDATASLGVFGVHGPNATEKLASVLNGAGAPDERLTFVRGRIRDRGVTVVRTDAPTGEEGYEVVCAAEAAPDVFDSLLTHGLNAAPFGRRTWETLTLEAGTPLFETELDGREPAAAGAVGDASSPRRLVGLAPEDVPESGAAVRADGRRVGEVTRAAPSPSLGEPIALAVVERGATDGLSVDADGGAVAASRVTLPFVEGSDRSGRCPEY